MKAFPVAILCEVMRVSRSGFYDYLFRYLDDNGPGEAELKSRIKEIFNNSGHSYGCRRIVKQLQAEGHQIGRYKGRRIMRQLNLKAITPKRFKRTTDGKHSFPTAPNILDRKFDVDVPNKVWTADISYVWTFEGWLYLAVVMDLHSRQIVGWAMNERMKKQLVIDALAMAYRQRKPPKGLLHHSDRGSRYASYDYQNLLESYGMQAGMSRKGNCWDNAPMERFFRSLKSERIDHYRFFTRNEAKSEILDYITFYNSIRLHSTLGYLSPMEYEKEHYLKVA
jgi:putative transposase